MRFDWYHRLDPWQLSACDAHGAELAALGFRRGGVGPLRAAEVAELGAAHQCALCNGTTTLAEVRACRCHVLGTPCPIHRPAPAGRAGDWSRVRCTQCGAELQLPADRIAFERDSAREGLLIAVDVTGWVRGDGDGDALRCPFHGAARYPLAYVSGPGADDDDENDELDDAELDDEQLH